MWGCFRLENEHLHNTQNFRRVAFVPLHFETAVARVSALHARGCFALLVCIERGGLTRSPTHLQPKARVPNRMRTTLIEASVFVVIVIILAAVAIISGFA